MAIQAQQLYSDNLSFPLRFSEDWMMDNICGFNVFDFNLQQQKQLQQQQQLQYLQQRNQNVCIDNSGLFLKNNTNNHQTMAFSQIAAYQFEKQKQEIDRFINLQNERLRLVLQEQRKQQMALLLKKYETKAQFMLRQKDEEIAKAMNRKTELENFLNRMEIETQTWQGLAMENEEMVMSLNNKIEQLRESVCLSTNGIEDAESCCDVIENRGVVNRGNHEEQIKKKMICKSCNARNSCVIFLPCRHLCSCKDCEAFLDSCPFCNMGKQAIIDVLI